MTIHIATINKQIEGKIVTRYNILGTREIVYAAYEPSDIRGKHSTIETFDGFPGWYGRIGTRALTPELDALPALTAERWNEVKNYFADQAVEAQDLILKAFPHLWKLADWNTERDEIVTNSEVAEWMV